MFPERERSADKASKQGARHENSRGRSEGNKGIREGNGDGKGAGEAG